MDHATAYIHEFSSDPREMQTIKAGSASDHSSGKSENVTHNKEQHQQAAYYKKLEAVIMEYPDVLLFGPSTAKEELANLLKTGHHSQKAKVVVKQADKMSVHQQYDFVKEHFSKH